MNALRIITRGVVTLAATSVITMASSLAHAQPAASRTEAAVSVTASATTTVANDRVQTWVRAEAESPDPSAAASQVNATMARGLARAKSLPGVTVSTSGYSTQQITDKDRPTRWRVTQTMTLIGSDFAQIATLLTALQGQDGLLLSGMTFSLSPSARERAEGTVIREAIEAWQARARIAADALGFDGWRTGHVAVQTSEPGRVFPMARMSASAVAESAPVSIEGGTTEVNVTVTGDAVLERQRASARSSP